MAEISVGLLGLWTISRQLTRKGRNGHLESHRNISFPP